MRLVRFGKKGQEKSGLLDSHGHLRDLSGVINDIDFEAVTPSGLERLRVLDQSQLPVVKGKPRLGAPLKTTGKFLAIGLNYRDHAEEANLPTPEEPIIFMKANSCICGPDSGSK